MAAAVADFAPQRARAARSSATARALEITLVPNPDIIAEVGEMPDDVRPFLIGFAAESDDLEANAAAKLRDKGLDLIVGNVVGGPFDAIGSDENKVTVFGAEGPLTDWPMLPKRQVAERLWDLIADRWRAARPAGAGRRQRSAEPPSMRVVEDCRRTARRDPRAAHRGRLGRLRADDGRHPRRPALARAPRP